jgi:hypothetical protein
MHKTPILRSTGEKAALRLRHERVFASRKYVAADAFIFHHEKRHRQKCVDTNNASVAVPNLTMQVV